MVDTIQNVFLFLSLEILIGIITRLRMREGARIQILKNACLRLSSTAINNLNITTTPATMILTSFTST